MQYKSVILYGMEIQQFTFTPIGVIRGGGDYPQQAPRQGVWAGNTGKVELFPGNNFETALEDLKGFARIWLIFVFDRNSNWKPKVKPPWGVSRKIGLFATRSPHRPNPIGISAVELISVEKLTLNIRNFDLLEGTPILDIKPYIPEADAFPDSAMGWRSDVPPMPEMEFAPDFLASNERLLSLGGPDLVSVARVQLGCHDLDPKTQRLTLAADGNSGILAYRTWRIAFERCGKKIRVLNFFSGYTREELAPAMADPYGDKALHRLFLA